MTKHGKSFRVLPLLAALALLGGGSALAAAGGKDDPLITLSYIDQTVIPSVVSQVETKTAARQAELEKALADQIEQYKKNLAANPGGTVSPGSEPGDASASFTLISLSKGQTLHLNVGCELLLRVGSATVNAATSPALIDTSTGGTISNGSALTQNHLYMATIPDRTLSPTAETVRLLIRGSYAIS